jgi:hypothetical protein
MYQQTSTIGTTGTLTFGTSVFSGNGPQPTAHITKSRGRLKTYGTKVYLKSGSNFEIELFNPKPIKVIAKVLVNGQLLSDSGIVLKPGQRVYLERFIDEPKKFMFETYEVEDSPEANSAIVNNGKVQVQFYDELVNYPRLNTFGPISSPTWVYQPGTFCYYNSCQSVPLNLSSNVLTSTTSASLNGTTTYTTSAAQPMETGRVEQGESSAQVLNKTHGEFNNWTCSISEWQILPESKKPVEMSEIRTYCTQCGTRNKKSSWKFCPNCGTKIQE